MTMKNFYYRWSIVLGLIGLFLFSGVDAEAQQQLCVPFSVFGQISDGTATIDGATVILMNVASQVQMQAVSAQGGYYLFEAANLNPCLAEGDTVSVESTFNNLSGSQSFIYAGGALKDLPIVMSSTGPGPDITPPVITILGANPVEVIVGTAYSDAGATATDTTDGNISARIQITGLPINTSAAGSFTVTYSVSDAAGNSATGIRTVNVVASDTTAPVISVVGDNPAVVAQNAVYIDAGATAIDAIDGNITSKISTTGLPINTATIGTYTITYSVSDLAGNLAQASRTVTVNAESPFLSTIYIFPVAPSAIDIGGTLQFSATAIDQHGTPITASVLWSSSTPSVGTIEASSGLFTAVGGGATTITAMSGSVARAVDVKVNAQVIPLPIPSEEPPPVAPIPPDTTNSPEISQIGKNEAEIRWTTPTPSATKLFFSSSSGQLSLKSLKKKKKKARTFLHADATTTHTVQLRSLKRNKKHYFRIVTITPDGQEKYSPIFRFKTRKK